MYLVYLIQFYSVRLSSAKEITRQVLKDIFHDICGASSYPLSTAQEDEILKALEQNSVSYLVFGQMDNASSIEKTFNFQTQQHFNY